MVRRHVVGNEVEHEAQAALTEAFAEPGEGRIAAEVRVNGVSGDGEAGALDVLVPEVGQRLFELVPPFRVQARDPPGRKARQSNPCAAMRSSSASRMSSRPARRPGIAESSVSQTLVFA
jgi:hypothetical protein